jgi:hypothetical protein
MKNLSEYIKEEISVSIGTEVDNSTYATPGNTTGMGNPKPPTPEEPGSGDLLGKTRKDKHKKKKV